MSQPASNDTKKSEYLTTYAQWKADMSPQQLDTLKRLGVLEPDNDPQQINGKNRSVEDMSFLSIEEIEIKNETEGETRADVIAAVVSRIRASGSPLLYIDALLSALRVHKIENMTCEELARRHGVTKQRFQTLRSQIIDAFNLPQAPGGMDEHAREKQSKRVLPAKPWVLYTAALDSWRRWWYKATRDGKLESWHEADKRLLRNELVWFVERYIELGGDMGRFTDSEEELIG